MSGAEEMPRMMRWLEELTTVGRDREKFKAVLNRVRDSDAGIVERDHFHLALAQEAAVWLQEAARGKPLTDEEREQLERAGTVKLEQFLQKLQTDIASVKAKRAARWPEREREAAAAKHTSDGSAGVTASGRALTKKSAAKKTSTKKTSTKKTATKKTATKKTATRKPAAKKAASKKAAKKSARRK